MKKFSKSIKKSICVLLSVLMFLTAVPLAGFVGFGLQPIIAHASVEDAAVAIESDWVFDESDTIAVKVYFVDAVDLKEWNFYFDYDAHIFEFDSAVMGADADAVMRCCDPLRNRYITEYNPNVDGVIKFGGYFKKALWTAEEFLAASDFDGECIVNDEKFEVYIFYFNVINRKAFEKTATTISLGGDLTFLEGGQKRVSTSLIKRNEQTSYFTIASDSRSINSIMLNKRLNGSAKYNVSLFNKANGGLNASSIDGVVFENLNEDLVDISTKKKSDTEIELIVTPKKKGEAKIKITNADHTVEDICCLNVYPDVTTYRADKVPVTNEKLQTNFSRGDLTVDNFEYVFDENKNKYVATMDVYNSSSSIGIVAAYTQDGLISDIVQVDPYIPMPGDIGEFFCYLGSGAVGIVNGDIWNYRHTDCSKKTKVSIEVPEDGYLTVSADIMACEATMIYNFVALGVETAFMTAEIIDLLAGTDTDDLAKKASKTIVEKVTEYFDRNGREIFEKWLESALTKISKNLSDQFSIAYLENMSMLSLDLLEEMCKTIGSDFSTMLLEVVGDLIEDEIKTFGVMSAAKKLIEDKVIDAAEKTFLKVASTMFEAGKYVNLANKFFGAYLYNVDTGKTMIVFEPQGENGFISKDTIKVTSDVITEDVLLNTYVLRYTPEKDAFVRGCVHPYFNRADGLDEKEQNIDLNRVIEIHEIALIKNGEEIDSAFTATVEMDIPSYVNKKTCSVYRVEKDGSYTKLKTKISGDTITFETDHFSQYILTGIRNEIEGTTPCDGHAYSEVKTEPTCTETGSIVYTCYCGDTYTETLAATGHTFDGNTCTSCGYGKDPACDHICHKDGFVGFIWKIVQFFWKLFGMNPVCECGAKHY